MATIKQKKAAIAVVVNGGNVSKGMIEAGYSENTAHTPQKLTESDGWKELMEKHLDDKKLAKKHDQLLNAESETVQLGALRLGYDVKGKIQQVIPPLATHITNINFFSNPKIMEATKQLDEAVKDYIINGDETKKPIETL